MPADARFCGACGTALKVADAPGAPKRLAEALIISRAALEGERKQVTVLFADLSGSMELLADRDPEEARALLDPVLELMMEAVHRYDGTVNQVMGDGVMALFGAPLAHEDHAVRACYAALRMQESVRARSTERAPIRIRVGLNSGEVVVRTVGSDLRMDYTAVGQTTHIAARFEHLATPDSIYMSSATRALAEGFIEARSLGPVQLKGMARTVNAHELLAAKASSSRFQVAASKGLTQFAGRAAETGALQAAFEEVKAGAGRAVCIAGEPGVGKSRLLWEFARALPQPAPRVLSCCCSSFDEATPYQPIDGLLRQYFRLRDSDDSTVVRNQVMRAPGAMNSTATAAILWLLGFESGIEGWAQLDPAGRRRRALDAVSELLLRASRAEPLIVIVEDLQWADPETHALLDVLVENLPGGRLLLVATYRPGFEHHWGRWQWCSRLSLEQLAPDAARELLRTLAGDSPSLETLKRALVQRAGGNPFFLEECVRALAEGGQLVGRPGDYRALDDADSAQVPASVHAVLAARIDRLPADEKRLLQAAAAIGMEVLPALLGAVAECSLDELHRLVGQLEGGGFLQTLRLYPEIAYTFQHALTCEVAYDSLVHERRQTLHTGIVRAIEALHAGRLDEQVERLAHHALRGELWPEVERYGRAAGARALARSANRVAVTHFGRALEATGRLAAGPAALEAAIDLRLELRSAYSPLGDHRTMFEVLIQAERLAEQLGDARRLALVASHLSNLHALRGEFARALELGERAAQIAESLADFTLRVVTSAYLAITHWARGEYTAAVASGERSLRVLTPERQLERLGLALLPAVYARTAILMSLAEQGEFQRCEEIGAQALAVAELSEHPQSLISACFGFGTALVRRGEFARAITLLERARGIAEETGLGGAFLEVASPLASAYAQSGRAADAIALLRGAVARAIALDNRLGHWLRSGGLAEAYLYAGRLAEALPAAKLFVELTRMGPARGNRAWGLLLLGEVLAGGAGQPAEAEEALEAALEHARELGMRTLEARCLLALGQAHRRWGAPQRAVAQLSVAAERFRARGMAFWQARADQELLDAKGSIVEPAR